MSTALLFFGAGQVSPPSQSIQPIALCRQLSLYVFVSFVFAVSAEPHKYIELGQTCRCVDILTLQQLCAYANSCWLSVSMGAVSGKVQRIQTHDICTRSQFIL